MPKRKVLARDWTLEVQTETDETSGEAIYVPILGLNTLTFSSEKEDADTTSFDSNGHNEHLPASRGNSLTAEGLYLVDPETGERDPGQEAVEDLADQVGPDGLGNFKLTDPGGNVREFSASANLSDQGGGNTDPTSWGAELTVSGAITKTTAV
ncbi:hypothetical protein SAMN05421676_1129 [Salinibacillus kushneri]|uniref:Phage major tail protein, TP901-1 family n=1 Tax=Salinibacillus kushneri TaxID=237682 RepID=A0A1I0IF97_9BACI|nr:hypothetical protein [Salinibacillus kushneri]SET94683.1 hypothetical protein SAMN05421676_1129 [Salinibacillus kushneri]